VVDLKRRGALSPLFRKKKIPIRVPFYKDFSLFDKFCPECEEKSCGKVCEEEIIKFDENGLPFLDFESSGCTFCKECALACPNEIFDTDLPFKINAFAIIQTALCIGWKGTMCFACKDVCEPEAIDFFGLYRPTVNQNCSGCGMCVNLCPTNAIKMEGEER
jgi:ferredoxin-type protein NapF